MAAVKVSIFFRQAYGRVLAGIFVAHGHKGWTEHYYIPESFSAVTTARVEAMIQVRMRLLSPQAQTTKYRLAELDPAGKVKTVKHIVFGNDATCDNVEQALTWQIRSGNSSNRRTLTLRGIPDARVVGGVYHPTEAYDNKIRAFFRVLIEGGWRFRGKGLAGASSRIQSISDAGVMVLRDNLDADVGNEVQVLRSFAAGHRAKGITTNITVETNAKNYTLAEWPYGASTGGRVRKVTATDYFPYEITDGEQVYPEACTRQTGSPPVKSRGRRSAKYS